MKNLFQPEVIEEIKERIEHLKPSSERQWGKMEVAQMLAHCSASMEVAVGEKHPPRMFVGRIFGPFVKSVFSNDKPLRKNTPTDKSFLVIDQRNFQKEKSRLLELIDKFASGGAEKVTKHPHSFFGKLTPTEWSTGMYKHLDHHLRQFGV
jgi:hypothetical protein